MPVTPRLSPSPAPAAAVAMRGAASPVVPVSPVEKTRPVAPSPHAVIIRRDEAAGRFIYEFRDPATGALLCQFPSEAMVALSAAMRDQYAPGLVLNISI